MAPDRADPAAGLKILIASAIPSSDQLGDGHTGLELLHQLGGIVIDADRILVERRLGHPAPGVPDVTTCGRLRGLPAVQDTPETALCLPLVQPGQLRQVDERVPFGHLTAERNATGTRDPDLIAGKPRLRRVARELAVLAMRGDEVLEIVADTHLDQSFIC